MKIAMVVPQFPCFGETFILSEITGLIDLGQDVDIIAVNPSGEQTIHDDVFRYKLLQQTKYLHINEQYGKSLLQRFRNGMRTFAECHRLSPRETWGSLNFIQYGRPALRLSQLFRLKPFLEKHYDVVHCHFGPNAMSFSFLTSLLGVKLIGTFHGYDFSRILKEQPAGFYHDLFGRADLITAVSQYGIRKLIAAGGNTEKIVQLRMSVPTDRFPFRERSLKPGETVRILTVARLFEKKGYEYTIRAVAKVAQALPNIEYWIVGDPNGPAAPKIRALIQELRVEDKVKILGTKKQAEVIDLHARCHLFVLASVTGEDGDEEGIPVGLMEAMASGLPVLSTLHSGIPELVEQGVSGYLVPERDADALAERLRFMIQHPEDWSRMGRAGRTFVEANFAANTLNKQLLGMYEALVAGKKPS